MTFSVQIFLNLQLGYFLMNPSKVENTVKLKTHLIQIAHQPSESSFTYHKSAGNTYIGTSHLVQSLFNNKLLNISCSLLNPVLKNRTVYGYRMVINVLIVCPDDRGADWELWLLPTSPSIRRYYQTTYG